jgi:hypothetical protein
MRTSVLAALREVYDGRWSRNVGTDGGRTLTWEGRIVLIGAVTTAYDAAHSVIASMGDRFALVRVDSSTGRMDAGRQALRNVGDETAMRQQLAHAAGGVLAGLRPELAQLDEGTSDALLDAADLVTLARTAVERDQRGEIIDAHAPEMPTRFAKMLGQIVRGALALGIDQDRAVALSLRVAADSIPPLRLAVLRDVGANPYARTSETTKRLQRPRASIDRVLQELHIIGLLSIHEAADGKGWRYTLADGIRLAALQPVTRNVSRRVLGVQGSVAADVHTPTDISGQPPAADPGEHEPDPHCQACGKELWAPASIASGLCAACAPSMGWAS